MITPNSNPWKPRSIDGISFQRNGDCLTLVFERGRRFKRSHAASAMLDAFGSELAALPELQTYREAAAAPRGAASSYTGGGGGLHIHQVHLGNRDEMQRQIDKARAALIAAIRRVCVPIAARQPSEIVKEIMSRCPDLFAELAVVANRHSQEDSEEQVLGVLLG